MKAVLFVLLFLTTTVFGQKNTELIDLTQTKWCGQLVTITEIKQRLQKKEDADCQKLGEFPIKLNEQLSVPVGSGIHHFLVHTEFNLTEEFLAHDKPPGLYLSGIGENFEIFLNGHSILNYLFIQDEKIQTNKTVEGLTVLFEKKLLHTGINRISIHFVGYAPTNALDKNSHLGFFFTKDYFLADADRVINAGKEDFTIILNGIYLFFGFFYLFIYFKTRTEKAYLHFGTYSILLALYLFHRTYFIIRIYQDTAIKDRVEYLVLFLLIPSFLLFLQGLFFRERKLFLISKIVIGFSSLLSLALLVCPFTYQRTMLILWQYSAIPSLLHCLVILIMAFWRKKPLSRPIAIGFFGLFCVNIWDIVDATWIYTGIRISQYGFFAFIIAILFVLTNQLLNYQIEIEKQKNAFIKFVPFNFIELLDKHSILDLQLGDQIQQEMTILFSDIRSFTALSEKMTPKENFDFINSYLNQSSPAIRNNHGFIDKYLGDGVMALFPKDTEDAITAAIEHLHSVHHYNTLRLEKNLRPIRIGIGIHTGMLMLGIVGEEERYDCTVISDAVNLAARIESLTKIYSASILISECTYKKIVDKNKYHIRLIDRVAVKGKKRPVRIYEIIDGLSERIQKLKIASKKDFESGIMAYIKKDFDMALQSFRLVLEIDPLDKAAELYITRIEYLQQHGVPLSWDGIERLEHK